VPGPTWALALAGWPGEVLPGLAAEQERQAALVVDLRVELPVLDERCGVMLDEDACARVIDHGVVWLRPLQRQRQRALLAALHGHPQAGVLRDAGL